MTSENRLIRAQVDGRAHATAEGYPTPRRPLRSVMPELGAAAISIGLTSSVLEAYKENMNDARTDTS
jgi:hypothetical protein